MHDYNWGKAITYLLNCRKMKPSKLKDASGVPKTTISMIQSGKRNNPTWETILKLAKGLQVHEDVLIHIARGEQAWGMCNWQKNVETFFDTLGCPDKYE